MMDQFDPFGFGAADRRQEQLVASARRAAKGLAHEQLVPSALITLSPNKATGDRSYLGDIWEVVAVTAGTLVMKPTGMCERPWSDRPRAIQVHEHEFYAAEALAEAINGKPASSQRET